MSTLQTPTTAHRHPSLALILTAPLIALAVAAAVVAFTATGGGEPDRTEFRLPSHARIHGGAPVPDLSARRPYGGDSDRTEFRLPSHARIHGGAPVPDVSARRP
jgi:hypothetical protein